LSAGGKKVMEIKHADVAAKGPRSLSIHGEEASRANLGWIEAQALRKLENAKLRSYRYSTTR
jgi:hypothetical protein